MLKSFSNYIRGFLRIEISGYSPERFINLCKNKGIEIWDLQATNNAYAMYISVQGFRKLKPILKKTRTHVIILKRYGVPFFFHKYRKRKIFFGCIMFCLILIYSLSLFVWDIRIEGNQSITDDVLMEYLDTQDVYRGMFLSKINCDEIRTDIRKTYDEIIWVSVSIEGTNLVIHLRENTDTFQVNEEIEQARDLVASDSGIIREIITRNGVPRVTVGTQVNKGDLLVSGIVDVLNDAGEVVRQEFKTADADIIAECQIPYEDSCPKVYEQKQYGKSNQIQYYIRYKNILTKIGFLKTDMDLYELYTDEKAFSINQTSLHLGKISRKTYQYIKKEHSSAQQKQILENQLEIYCKKLEQQDQKIMNKNVQFVEEENTLKLKGNIVVQKSIGIPKRIDF